MAGSQKFCKQYFKTSDARLILSIDGANRRLALSLRRVANEADEESAAAHGQDWEAA